MDTIEARFTRPEPRRRVRDFVAGLLAPLPVKNCWTIAEHAGDSGPGGNACANLGDTCTACHSKYKKQT